MGVDAEGLVQGEPIHWIRSLNSPSSRTTYGNAGDIKRIATEADEAIRSGKEILLPLISYYGTGRLWQEPRDAYQVSDPADVTKNKDLSRLSGYKNSIDPRLSVSQFTRWIARQSWISFQQNSRPSPAFVVIKNAVISCLEHAIDLRFDAKLGEVVIDFPEGSRPFSLLSDGQRCMLAMVGDLAQKAARLNPHLGANVLTETPGIVIIDELDLHLHPQWQRHVIEDLRNTFKNVQFICTTHSPFLIQSLRSGEELIMMEGAPMANVDNLSIEAIVMAIQGVENSEVSARYNNLKNIAKDQLERINLAADLPSEEKKKAVQELSTELERHKDEPAFQAFLELKRAVKLGE